MSLLMVPSVCSAPSNSKAIVRGKHLISSSNNRNPLPSYSVAKFSGFGVRACFFNPDSSPIQEPILKEALKEPVAFVGGMFAGLLRLDLNEEPLKEWIKRTVEASGISEEETDKSDGVETEEMFPQQIEIE